MNTFKGGSSDNGPTAKKFFSSEFREAILNLFQNISDDERTALGLKKLLKLYFNSSNTLVNDLSKNIIFFPKKCSLSNFVGI